MPRRKKRQNKKPGYALSNCFFSRAERNGGGGGGGCDSLLFVPCQKVCDIRTLQDVVRLLYNSNPFHLLNVLMSFGIFMTFRRWSIEEKLVFPSKFYYCHLILHTIWKGLTTDKAKAIMENKNCYSDCIFPRLAKKEVSYSILSLTWWLCIV